MSEFTDKVDADRREDIHFNTWVASCKVELTGHENRKKEIIIEGKEKLEQRGYDKEKISATLGDKFEGYISRQYIRKVLGDDYKDKSKVRDQQQQQIENKEAEICATVAQNNPELEQPERLLVTANGHIVRESESDIDSELDSIYGKDYSQMKREADREIAEDNEETLENPANGPNPTPGHFLSDKSQEFRAMEARVEELELTIHQLVEDRDTAIKNESIMSSKFNKLRGGVFEDELKRLKVENNNLLTLMGDVDRESLAKEGYKEIEVLKLNPGTERLLMETSRKSQRTFFLLVHPKTMQVKAAKTDVAMHQIQAKRAAGVQ